MESSQEKYKVLAQEIELMLAKDQEMRRKVREGEPWDLELDKKHTERAKQIIEEIGYPTKSKLGDKASHSFWFLIQHADHDPHFQKECLELMRSLPKEEIEQADIAFLDDRVRAAEGKPLLYGTQFWTDPTTGIFEPKPIEDIENLDARRASMGLKPFKEYREQMEKLYT